MTDDNRALLAHLFRRAGFGAGAADLDAYVAKGYATAVDELTNPSSTARNSGGMPQTTTEPLSQPNFGGMQQQWLQSMVTSKAPLVERMSLFLSNHFVSSYSPGQHVDTSSLQAWQAKIRKYSLGSFAELAHAMIDDKALGCYLDIDKNNMAKPNENVARELMELFMLGAGNFSETDVKETARALTGYKLASSLPGARPNLVFDSKLHDAGPKTILGTTANFTPHSVIDLFLNHPASRRFIATKLVTHFVGPSPDSALVSSVVAALTPDWQLANALRTIFNSTQFRDEATRQTRAKTPAEYVAGLMRGLVRNEYHDGALFMTNAGQALYRAPSVAGWPQDRRMLGPGAMLARYNAASNFALWHVNHPAAGAPSGPEVAPWMAALGMTSLSPSTLDALNAYSTATARNTTAVRTAGVITVLASSPDFNLS